MRALYLLYTTYSKEGRWQHFRPHFSPGEFTFPGLIGAVRDEIAKLPAPSTKFAVPKSARYNAAGSPGKGKNFNFKVQRKDSSKPNGWSAVAQIHVIWA